MNKVRILAVSLLIALLLASAAVAQDSKAIVERAIVAHGGEAKLARMNKVHSVAEGTIDALPGQPPLPFVGESWRMEGNSKMVVTMRLQGQKISVTDAVHGDTKWRQLAGVTQDLSKEEAAEVDESRHVDQIAKLGFLKDSAIELSALPEAKISDKPAAGVVIKLKGHKDVKLYFDKETNLLVKIQHPALDLLSGKEVTEELVLSDYQDKDGLKYAMKSELWRDGQKIMEGKVTKLEFVDKMDEKIFARP
jgi:hypothetical protein